MTTTIILTPKISNRYLLKEVIDSHYFHSKIIVLRIIALEAKKMLRLPQSKALRRSKVAIREGKLS